MASGAAGAADTEVSATGDDNRPKCLRGRNHIILDGPPHPLAEGAVLRTSCYRYQHRGRIANWHEETVDSSSEPCLRAVLGFGITCAKTVNEAVMHILSGWAWGGIALTVEDNERAT